MNKNTKKLNIDEKKTEKGRLGRVDPIYKREELLFVCPRIKFQILVKKRVGLCDGTL